MATRFVNTLGSEGAALADLADRANEATETAYNTQATSLTTIPAAKMVNAVFRQTGTPGAYNMTTDTAANIVAALKNAQAGSAFDFVLQNTGDNTITILAASGAVTLVGVTAVPTNKTQIYKGIVTNSGSGTEAVTLIGLLYAPV